MEVWADEYAVLRTNPSINSCPCGEARPGNRYFGASQSKGAPWHRKFVSHYIISRPLTLRHLSPRGAVRIRGPSLYEGMSIPSMGIYIYKQLSALRFLSMRILASSKVSDASRMLSHGSLSFDRTGSCQFRTLGARRARKVSLCEKYDETQKGGKERWRVSRPRDTM